MFESISGYRDADVKKAECQESVYTEAMKLRDGHHLEQAIAMLQSIESYRDAAVQIETITAQFEEERCIKIYEEASHLIKIGGKAFLLQAKRKLETIKNYRDSEELIRLCDEGLMGELHTISTANMQRRASVEEQRKFHGLCQHCGGRFSGLIIKKCSKCGKPKDY